MGQSGIIGVSVPTSDDVLEPIAEQIWCYVQKGLAIEGQGLWGQLYDNEVKGTVAAGALAFFSADTPSLISWMNIEDQIPVNSHCITHDEL